MSRNGSTRSARTAQSSGGFSRNVASSAIENNMFSLIYTMVRENPFHGFTMSLALVADIFQLMYFGLAVDVYEWGSPILQKMSDISSLFTINISTMSPENFQSVFVLVSTIIAGTILLGLVVAWDLRSQRLHSVLIIHVLRLAGYAVMTILFLPFMSVLVAALTCHKGDDAPFEAIAGLSSTTCTLYTGIAGVVAPVFFIVCIYVSLGLFNPSMFESGWLARFHSRVDFRILVFKSVLVLAFILMRGNVLALSFVGSLSVFIMLYNSVSYLPFYLKTANIIRSCYQYVAVVCFLTAAVGLRFVGDLESPILGYAWLGAVVLGCPVVYVIVSRRYNDSISWIPTDLFRERKETEMEVTEDEIRAATEKAVANIKFRSPWEIERAFRFVLRTENPNQAAVINMCDSIFNRGIARYNADPLPYLAMANVLININPDYMRPMNLVRKASQMPVDVELRYFVFYFEKERSRVQSLTGDTMMSSLRLQKNLHLVNQFEKKTNKAASSFWRAAGQVAAAKRAMKTHLSSVVDINLLGQKAKAYYNERQRLHDFHKRVLKTKLRANYIRRYSNFLSNHFNNKGECENLLRIADDVETEESMSRRKQNFADNVSEGSHHSRMSASNAMGKSMTEGMDSDALSQILGRFQVDSEKKRKMDHVVRNLISRTLMCLIIALAVVVGSTWFSRGMLQETESTQGLVLASGVRDTFLLSSNIVTAHMAHPHENYTLPEMSAWSAELLDCINIFMAIHRCVMYGCDFEHVRFLFYKNSDLDAADVIRYDNILLTESQYWKTEHQDYLSALRDMKTTIKVVAGCAEDQHMEEREYDFEMAMELVKTAIGSIVNADMAVIFGVDHDQWKDSHIPDVCEFTNKAEFIVENVWTLIAALEAVTLGTVDGVTDYLETVNLMFMGKCAASIIICIFICAVIVPALAAINFANQELFGKIYDLPAVVFKNMANRAVGKRIRKNALTMRAGSSTLYKKGSAGGKGSRLQHEVLPEGDESDHSDIEEDVTSGEEMSIAVDEEENSLDLAKSSSEGSKKVLRKHKSKQSKSKGSDSVLQKKEKRKSYYQIWRHALPYLATFFALAVFTGATIPFYQGAVSEMNAYTREMHLSVSREVGVLEVQILLERLAQTAYAHVFDETRWNAGNHTLELRTKQKEYLMGTDNDKVQWELHYNRQCHSLHERNCADPDDHMYLQLQQGLDPLMTDFFNEALEVTGRDHLDERDAEVVENLETMAGHIQDGLRKSSLALVEHNMKQISGFATQDILLAVITVTLTIIATIAVIVLAVRVDTQNAIVRDLVFGIPEEILPSELNALKVLERNSSGYLEKVEEHINDTQDQYSELD